MHKTIVEQLKALGLLKYGAVIPGDTLRKLCGVSLPTAEDLQGCTPHEIRRRYDSIKLHELSHVDVVRSFLLDEGKYLAQQDGDYRILLASENARQAEVYMRSGDRKLQRAAKLLRNTPAKPNVDADVIGQLQARIMMKRESIRGRLRRQEDRHAP